MKIKMNKNKFQKGFTLIELLVVIAIIGILAAVLLVNLASTRNSAKDAAVRLEMGQLRTAMESFNSSGTSYVGGFASAEPARLITSISGKAAAASTGLESIPAWCRRVSLNVAGAWCVDSTGYSGVPLAAGDCAGVDSTCN